MKKMNWLLVAFLLINAIGCYADGNYVLYVSPKGNDRNVGTLSRPLKTIGMALGKMKETTADQQVEVVLRGGTYEIDATLEVNRDHVFIHPYQEETVTISGGKSVTRNSLKPVKEQAVLDRLPTASQKSDKRNRLQEKPDGVGGLARYRFRTAQPGGMDGNLCGWSASANCPLAE